jgi:predicted MPP superfamily phosphohydrolase
MLAFVRGWLLLFDGFVLATGLALAALGVPGGLFLAALVPLAFAPFSYARWRLHRTIHRALGGVRLVEWPLAIAGVACDVVLVLQLVSARAVDGLPALQGPIIGWLGPIWFSGHALALLGYLLGGAARRLGRLALRAWRRVAPASFATVAAEAPPRSIDRRAFLRQMSVAAAVLPFAASASGVSTSYDFRVDEREIVLPHWPRELDGLRVVHLSDIHVGGGMTRERLLRVAELTNRAKPDLVAHTGDFLTHRSGEFDTPLYEALARVHAPLGQWACLGNHDYEDPDRLVRRLRDAGVTTLRNARARIDVAGRPLELAGSEFVFPRPSRPSAYGALIDAWGPRDGTPRLFLNHDPITFRGLPDGAADLVLSGHTHGGHVGVQLGPRHALTVVGLVGLPDQGVFARGDMRLFVTRCVGFYGYPMRVGIPPEIAVLVLRSPTTTGPRAA